MTLVVPNAGEAAMLRNILNHTAPQNLQLRLYTNNITPAETDTAATYTQATFSGYAAVNLVGANWVIVEGAPSEASYAQQSFASDAAQAVQQVYGYYAVEQTSGLIKWAERFTDGPYAIANDGDAIRVTPRITLD